ncbi:hypothetical protein RHSIM_Rhsim01G0052700 [Rhododendron simsii]|uniref:Uncharacterized protein n=1 Tax=Rhododendron simsii TaxID=118357 RepID=A0A834HFV5_RHOSS|nr:hypothetical protein RHSIM_Rhsim01G0052700 [Rhododendron simsii]
MPPIFPSPFDITRILFEEAIRAMIEDIRRRIEQRNGYPHLNCAMTSNCELPFQVMGLKSFNNEAMSTEEAVSKLLDGIPPEYVDQLQNPEEMVKRLNIDVPPECMPEVAVALAKHYNRRHLPLIDQSNRPPRSGHGGAGAVPKLAPDLLPTAAQTPHLRPENQQHPHRGYVDAVVDE